VDRLEWTRGWGCPAFIQGSGEGVGRREGLWVRGGAARGGPPGQKKLAPRLVISLIDCFGPKGFHSRGWTAHRNGKHFRGKWGQAHRANLVLDDYKLLGRQIYGRPGEGGRIRRPPN